MRKKPDDHGRRTSDNLHDKAEEKRAHWSDYMYASYDAETDVISLYRITPKEHLGVPCAGWLDDVEPGMFEGYVREHYGGGEFRLNRRNRKDGQIAASCTFVLPGFPKVSSAVNRTTPSEEQGAAASPVMIDIAGAQVPFTGDLNQFGTFVMMLKGIKSVFPDPPDINAVLLERALTPPPQPDPIETIRALKEAAGLFGGPAETGAGVYDLINNAINKVPVVLQALGTPNIRRIAKARPAALPRAAVREQLGPAPVTSGADAGNGAGVTGDIAQTEETETTTEEGARMSTRDLVLSTASTIVQCWRLDPPKDVAATVRMVDLILQQNEPAVRKQLAYAYAETIRDVAETQLVDDWGLEEVVVGDRKSFNEYVDKVFAEYAREDRAVVVI